MLAINRVKHTKSEKLPSVPLAYIFIDWGMKGITPPNIMNVALTQLMSRLMVIPRIVVMAEPMARLRRKRPALGLSWIGKIAFAILQPTTLTYDIRSE